MPSALPRPVRAPGNESPKEPDDPDSTPPSAPDWRNRVGRAVVTLLLVLVFLSPILFREGWPQNHEFIRNFSRTEIYAAHFKRGDIFPVWSESAVIGSGGPVPIYYHKLFHGISGLLRVLGFSLKASVLLTVGGFAALGWEGMRRLLKQTCPGPEGVLMVVAAAAVFSNYAFQVWIIRGAMAEFSAMMLVPWGIAWCLRVARGWGEKSILTTGLWLFPGLYLAHSMIFFFFAGPVLGAVLLGMRRKAGRRAGAARLVLLGGWFFLLVAPILYLQHCLGEGFGFFEGIRFYRAEDHLKPMRDLLWHRGFQWGQQWENLSLAINPVTLAAALAGIAGLGILGWRMSRGRPLEALERRTGAVGLFLLAMIGYYLFWLSPVSRNLYIAWPAFSLLQFPFRLLSFLEICLPVLAWAGASRWVMAAPRKTVLPLALACAALFLATSPWIHPLRFDWLPAEEVEKDYNGRTTTWVGYAEYAPLIAGLGNHRRMEKIRSGFHPHPWVNDWSTDTYTVTRIDENGFEAGERTFRIAVGTASDVVLPFSYTRSLRVTVETGNDRVPLKTWRTPDDPRVHFQLPTGDFAVTIEFPTVWSVLFAGTSG